MNTLRKSFITRLFLDFYSYFAISHFLSFLTLFFLLEWRLIPNSDSGQRQSVEWRTDLKANFLEEASTAVNSIEGLSESSEVFHSTEVWGEFYPPLFLKLPRTQ